MPRSPLPRHDRPTRSGRPIARSDANRSDELRLAREPVHDGSPTNRLDADTSAISLSISEAISNMGTSEIPSANRGTRRCVHFEALL